MAMVMNFLLLLMVNLLAVVEPRELCPNFACHVYEVPDSFVLTAQEILPEEKKSNNHNQFSTIMTL